MRSLFPSVAVDDYDSTLFIAVPMPRLDNYPPPMRHWLCDIAYDRAGREAARLMRERVGSSVACGQAALDVPAERRAYVLGR